MQQKTNRSNTNAVPVPSQLEHINARGAAAYFTVLIASFDLGEVNCESDLLF